MTEEEKQLTQMLTYVLQELCMNERVQTLVGVMGYDILKLVYYNKKLHMMACDKCKGLEEKRQEYRKASRGDDEEDPFTEYARQWFNQEKKETEEGETPKWLHNLLNDMDKLDLL